MKFCVNYFYPTVKYECWLERIFIIADNDEQADRIVRAYCEVNPYEEHLKYTIQKMERK